METWAWFASNRAQRPSDAELEWALREHPLVQDCALLMRVGTSGVRRIAYVVTWSALPAAKLEAHLADLLPRAAADAARVDHYMFVNRLPRDPEGRLDERALGELPMVDEALAAQVESDLVQQPGVAHAAVFVEEQPGQLELLHESDLLPALAVAAPALPSPTTPAAPRKLHAGRAGERGPSAEVAGTTLPVRSDAPRTLPEALRSAAVRFSDARITYLGRPTSAEREPQVHQQTFTQLLDEARSVHGGLCAAGLERGARVLLLLERPEQILPTFWGCLLGGYVPCIAAVPASYDAETIELVRVRQVLALLENPVIVANETCGLPGTLHFEQLRAGTPVADATDLDAEATAFLTLTSGSTGAPKAIMLSHRNILARAEGTNLLCDNSEGDRILNWLPFDHIGSISDWHVRCVLLGCHMVYGTKEHVLADPLNWLRLIDRFRISHSWAPNFAFALVNDALKRSGERWDLSCLNTLLTAGEAVSSSTVREFLARLKGHGLSATALRPAFGMAELGSGVTYFVPTLAQPTRVHTVDRTQLEGVLLPVAVDDPRAVAFTSLGKPIPGSRLRIVDDDYQVLPEDTVGKLQIGGAPVCLGYLQNPEANREVFASPGWFSTGDRGFVHAGELYLTGRDKETLVIRGANFSSSELESAVESVEGVLVSFTAACAVRTLEGERLAIFFCPEAAPDADALHQLLARVQSAVAQKTGVRPDYLLPVTPASVPKTAIGKIQRKALVKRFESGEFEALVRHIDLLTQNERTIPDWFVTPSFRPKTLRAPRPDRGRASYLLIADRHGFAAYVAHALEAHGAHATIVADDEPLPTHDCTQIVDLTDFGPSGEEEALATAERAAVRIGRLIAHCSSLKAERVSYRVVAAYAQATQPEDTVDPARAAVPVLLKTLAAERSDTRLACAHLDLPFSIEPAERAELARALAAECVSGHSDEEVVYRAGRRLVRAFERVRWSGAAARAPRIARGGLYLITGGLGGVGVELAKYLLERSGATLVLVGRSALQAPEAALRRQRLLELEALGPVHYVVADASDPTALAQVVVAAETRTGKPLCGIFHLAVAPGERTLAAESPTSLAEAFAPKLCGTAAVSAVAQAHAAFVVCFSSAAALFGGASLGSYAAANRMLAAYCHEARRKTGQAIFCIDWSLWSGLGIGESAPVPALRAKGLLPIATRKGMHSLAAALSLAPGQIMIGVDPSHARVAPAVEAPVTSSVRLCAAIVPAVAVAPGEFERATVHDAFGKPLPVTTRVLVSLPLSADGSLDRASARAAMHGTARREQVSPATPNEHLVAQLFRAVLGLDAVSTEDSFFELGGTSLLSVRLFAEIERAVGVSLPLASLLRTSSVTGLAQLLDAAQTSQRSSDTANDPGRPFSPLVPIQRGNGDKPLFCVHGAGGNVLNLRDIARRLGDQQTFYGLQARGVDGSAPLRSVDEMAASYIEAVRSVQPSGPYYLGGYSGGGVVAYEMAQRLRQAGEQVALLVFFDTFEAGIRPKATSWRTHLERLQTEGANYPLQWARSKLSRHFSHALKQLKVRLCRIQSKPVPLALRDHQLSQTIRQATQRYQPAPYRGAVVLYRAAQVDPPFLHAGPKHGWDHLATDLHVVDVPGTHDSLVREPNVGIIAAHLRASLAATPRSPVAAASDWS